MNWMAVSSCSWVFDSACYLPFVDQRTNLHQLMKEMRALTRFFSSRISSDVCMVSAAEITSKIDTCLRNNNIDKARKLFDENPALRSCVSWNMMMSSYIQHGQFHLAKNLFDEMPVKDVVSWNIMLSGYQRTGNIRGLCKSFLQMGRVSVAPNNYTISTLLTAVVNTDFNVLAHQIHARAVHTALNLDIIVGSALITAYASLGEKNALGGVFDELLTKDVTSWNAIVSGYMEIGSFADAQRTFDLMPEKDIISWTTLVNGYIRNKQIDKARSIFNAMKERNVVTWTTMISGYVQNMRAMEALELFILMLKSESRPNHFTFSSVLDACADCSYLLMGQQVHQNFIKSGIPEDIVISTSLVDMYAKCGDTDAAFCVFESIPRKNLASWNSIIGGYARHGLANQALKEFNRLIETGLTPNKITYVNVLSACVHAGLLEEGEKHFIAMQRNYGIQTEMEHYTCMVDLYGRAGQLQKAQEMIKNMPFEPDVVLWSALLAACVLHSNVELGEFAAQKMRELQKNHSASYTLLSKIQGEKGRWSSVNELREKMRKRQIQKQKAFSWVEFHLAVNST
ncbi:pentatricopeptide repeat-containing protein At4g02750-like [Neltuma alba]|uniref:pentatricopeptide repeat-containing protein At4g02750-like n=1 Tax=Neltuma alba TaxID=207710 RepID=UPI0010A2B9C3|nr:pentatricopeptide repeat-containing protein At4g02750-like [Prosopis alba]